MKIVLIEKNVVPYGVKCAICGRIGRAGQFVLLHTIPNVQHVLLHKSCIENTLEEIPDEVDKNLVVEYDRIRNQYIEGQVFDEFE